MASENRPIERAIRSRIHEGQELLSPGTGYPPQKQEPFNVVRVSDTGIEISKLTQEVRFDALESAVLRMRSAGDEVLIGGKQGWADPGTLERFLQDARGNSTRTSTYVAPILVQARVAEYVPEPGAKRIRLIPPHMENPP